MGSSHGEQAAPPPLVSGALGLTEFPPLRTSHALRDNVVTLQQAMGILGQAVQSLCDSLTVGSGETVGSQVRETAQGRQDPTKNSFKEVLAKPSKTGGKSQKQNGEDPAVRAKKKIEAIRRFSTARRPICFRCGDSGHMAANCPNKPVCFACQKVGHRSWECQELTAGGRPQGTRSTVTVPAPKPHPIPHHPTAIKPNTAQPQTTPRFSSPTSLDTNPDLDPDLTFPMTFIKRFNSSHASMELEAAFKRSIFLANTEGWGRERFLETLRQIAPFSWKVSTFPGGYMLVEGPEWWSEQVLQAGFVVLEGRELLAEPWDQTAENGFRLKSTWVKVLGFPLKLWHRAEFEKLIEDFGVLLEIDQATEAKTSFVEAKIRIGVSARKDIPAFGKAFYRNDQGDWVWKPVKFVIDSPMEARASGSKRRRIWVRRSDPSSQGSGPSNDKGKQPEDVMQEDGEGEDYADEDFLDEDRRFNRHTVGSDVNLTREIVVAQGVGMNSEFHLSSAQVNTEAEKHLGEHTLSGVTGRSVVTEAARSASVSSVVSGTQEKTQTVVDVVGERSDELEIEPEIVHHVMEIVNIEAEGQVVQDVQPLAQVRPGDHRPVTRQSVRQKLLDPEVPVQAKAMHRSKIKNLELEALAGTNSLYDHFPFNDWDDEQVVCLLQGIGLKLADKLEDSVECVQFLKSLSRKQFESALEEMEFKLHYGAKFMKKERDKRQKLDQIISRVSQFQII